MAGFQVILHDRFGYSLKSGHREGDQVQISQFLLKCGPIPATQLLRLACLLPQTQLLLAYFGA